jgi:hypothetical protein
MGNRDDREGDFPFGHSPLHAAFGIDSDAHNQVAFTAKHPEYEVPTEVKQFRQTAGAGNRPDHGHRTSLASNDT